jgi:hypothetical protein
MESMRLRDEGATAFERALLDAGSAYRGSPSARAKTLGALGLAGSAGLLGATAARTSMSLGKLTLGKLSLGKILAGVAFVGAVAAVPAGYQAWHKQQLIAQNGRAVALPTAAPVVVPPVLSPPADVAPPVAGDVGTRHDRHAAGQVPLARELASIDAARAALSRGDASGAVTRLDQYARSYPRGRLTLEADVLRIDALAESGRTEAARAHARDFLRRHPNSVLAAHVRTRLAD